ETSAALASEVFSEPAVAYAGVRLVHVAGAAIGTCDVVVEARGVDLKLGRRESVTSREANTAAILASAVKIVEKRRRRSHRKSGRMEAAAGLRGRIAVKLATILQRELSQYSLCIFGLDTGAIAPRKIGVDIY